MSYSLYHRSTRWASVFTLGCTLLLSACDSLDGPSDLAPSAVSASATKAPSDDRIVFESQKAFEETYAKLAEGDEAELNAYEKEQSFTSMRSTEASDANAAKKGDLAPDDAYVGVIEDPVLSTLVSPNGLIQIGETVYKVGAEYVFEGSEKDASFLGSANESDLLATKNMQSFRIEREIPSGPTIPGPGPTEPGPTPPDTTTTPTPTPAPSSACTGLGSRYKLCGRSFITNYGFISVSGVTSRISKRGWFGIYYPVRGDVISHTAVLGSTTVANTCTRAYLCYSVVSFSVTGSITGTLNTTHNATHAGSSASVQTSATAE